MGVKGSSVAWASSDAGINVAERSGTWLGITGLKSVSVVDAPEFFAKLRFLNQSITFFALPVEPPFMPIRSWEDSRPGVGGNVALS